LPSVAGAAAVLAGSCSAATLGQIAAFKGPHLHLDTDAACRGEPVAEAALAWAGPKLGNAPILLSASDTPESVKALQAKYGVEKSSQAIERVMAALAKGLVSAGVRRLVVAGGETSGAVVGALDVTALRIGPEIDPGVPWTASIGNKPLLLALKSGNFGAPDFFTKAFARR
jgi:3-dehydrotetronate 4-kinase